MIPLLLAALLPVSQFVKDCLDNDWSKLETFSLGRPTTNRLAETKWLTSPERLQDPDDMILSRAMYRDLWQLERPTYRGDTMNTFRTVFGREVESNLVTKVDQKFENLPAAFKARRAEFYWTYHSLGNYIPLPNDTIMIGGRPTTLNMYRAGIWRDYFSEFLVAVRTYLEGKAEEKAKLPKEFLELMTKTDYFWSKYRGAFKKYVDDFYLQDYLDTNGEIIRLPIIRWWDRGLKEDVYLSAAEKYLDYAERVIRLRTQRLIQALKTKQ